MMRGEFATNWWARRWIAALEAFGWEDRLRRGRSYARSVCACSPASSAATEMT